MTRKVGYYHKLIVDKNACMTTALLIHILTSASFSNFLHGDFPLERILRSDEGVKPLFPLGVMPFLLRTETLAGDLPEWLDLPPGVRVDTVELEPGD